MLVCADSDFDLPVHDVVYQRFGNAEHLGCVEDGAGSVREGVVGSVLIASRTPLVDVRLEGIPVRVAAGGVGLPDAGGAVADPDGLLLSDGVRELGEASVFFGDDEGLVHHSSSS